MLWTLDHLLFVTAVAVIIAGCLVVCIFLALSRHYPHEGTRAALGTATVSIVVTVLFGVVVNNLYSLKRDRDSRLRNIRDQHYAQLKPVLRTEATRLQDIAEQIRKSAHIASLGGQFENSQLDPTAMLWPDVLSRDLSNHFPEYEVSKTALLAQIEAQDQEFRDAVAVAQKDIHYRGVDAYWREGDAVSYVQKCLGRGNG